MKKLMMIAAMMVAALSANAQNEVGQITLKPMVGLNLASVTGDVVGNTSKKLRVGLAAGVEGEYGITDNFGITAGILYSMEGVKVSSKGNDDINVTAKLDYINIPILANIYLAKGFAVKAGIQPAFNASKKFDVDYPTAGLSQAEINYIDKVIDATVKPLESNIESFNLSIPIGLSYEYDNFVFDARYHIGVTKLVKDSNEGRNSTFMFSIGYKFAL
jgi:hypothetical protein